MDWKYWHYISQLQRTTKKVHVNFVVSSLFHDSTLRHLCPYTQFYVKRTDSGYALLDLYYPQLDLAIEIDEPFHAGNTTGDNVRENIVTDELNCEFCRIRINESNILDQIANIKKRIVLKTEEYKKQGEFVEWSQPRAVDMSELKAEMPETIFVRVIGEVHPDKLYARETGTWQLAEYNRIKLKQAVVVHNKMITRVFKDLKWSRCSENPKKWRFDASEEKRHRYLGTIVDGWKSQGSFTYSSDIGG